MIYDHHSIQQAKMVAKYEPDFIFDSSSSTSTRLCDIDVSSIVDITDGGCHGCINTAPNDAAAAVSVSLLRRCGVLVQLGMPAVKGADGTNRGVQISPFDIVARGVTVKGSLVGTRLDLKEVNNIFPLA